MKKKTIICVIIGIIIFLAIAICTFSKFGNSQTETTLQDVTYEEDTVADDETLEKISEIIESQSLEANESIYELDTEYDGREVIVVKPNVSYNVAMAGMIKKSKPDFSEIEELLKQAPTHTGIWIEESSREDFISILNNIGNSSYEVDEDGYLIQNYTWNSNNYDKRIKELLTDSMLHSFCISSTTYLVDEVTGGIEEYPFEQMDPYSEYEYFVADQKEMFIVSENNYGKVETEDCIKSILDAS